ncbi:fumarylacetoacetate hydrolase family protein [Chryseomicrobium aureum]|uniref:fumarylacetoacetate hydrolase family protein n=1 Tax=Chryseomicrobium aureum TaxID=1441723 RepID=UPI00370D89C6
MKLLQFIDNDQMKLGIKVNQGIIDVQQFQNKTEFSFPSTISELLENVNEGRSQLIKLIKYVEETNSSLLNVDEIEFGPVIDSPGKIICIGLNYIPHVKESNMKIPEYPVVFSKFNNTLTGHKHTIELPNVAEKYDYEAELVVVMGKSGKDISEEDALDYVLGYTIGNDVSARDLQMLSGQWLLGKTLNDFAPVGPYLLMAEDVDPTNLDIECKVNGELRQSSNTKNMIFSCATLISYISKFVTLEPGDIIFTGTPEGVILGYSEEKQVWLKSGDQVEVSISGLGSLVNTLK